MQLRKGTEFSFFKILFVISKIYLSLTLNISGIGLECGGNTKKIAVNVVSFLLSLSPKHARIYRY